MNIDYKSQLVSLQELQEVDLRLHNISQALEELPKKLSEAESQFNQVKEEHDKLKSDLDEVEKMRRTTELELNDAVANLADRETKLYAIKTTKEYQAAIKEVAETKRLNKEREDAILASMEKIEQLKSSLAEIEKKLSDAESKLNVSKEEISKQMDELNSLASKDRQRRPELLNTLDKEVIRKYEFVRKRYANALVSVDGGVCLGCHMNIPPQLFNELLRMNEFKFCPSCRRMIFPRVTEEQKTTE